MKRKVGYEWRLREVTAQHKMFTATGDLPAPLTGGRFRPRPALILPNE